MGLKIWLPMLGNLNNQGVLQGAITPMSTSVTANSNGKIGSCMSCNGTADSNIRIPPVLKYTDNFTVACWVKFNSTSNQCLFSQRTAVNSFGFTIFYLNGNGIKFDEGRSLEVNNIITTNTWYHIACCRDDTTTYIYLNGTLVATGTRASTAASNVNTNYAFIGGSQHNTAGSSAQPSNNVLNGYLNDYRIYNHCLSAAEVHEISQGLVLHYKLDNPYSETTTNLLAIDKSYSEEQIVTISHETNTNAHINAGILASNAGNNIITYSVYITNNTDTTIYPRIRGMKTDNSTWGSWVNGNTIASGTSGWAIVTLNMTDTSIYNGTSVYVRWQLGKARNTITGNAIFYHAQMEKKDHRTPWMPGGSTRLGFIEDSSGYGYTGTIINDPILNNDTARYSASTSFPTDADGILSTYPLKLWNNAFTYSFWIKPSGENGGRSVYAASYSGTTCSIEKTTGNKLRFYWNGSPDLSTSSLTITDGIWQHIAIVKEENKTTVKCYYNGVLKDTFTNTFSDKTFSGDLRIARDTRGNATSYTGMMSDFRIYCTALSTADIKQLYEVGAKVDNKQSLHTFELNESNSGRELLAVPLTTAYNSNTIRTNYDANGEITLTGKVSVGSDYIKINPVGKKYYFDVDLTVSASNRFYIGFQRYDASKSSRSGDATMYMLNMRPSTNEVHKHYHLVWDTAVAISNQTTNFGYFDSNTPVDTIRLRILNDWNSPSSRTATIHSISFREVPLLQNTKINKKGQVITDELMEMNVYCRIQKNGIVETPQIIEI